MKQIQINEELFGYLSAHQKVLHPQLTQLVEETRRRPDAGMQISSVQGVFMYQLAQLIGAQRILEIGCFTGYSAICMGLALPEKGRLISCDIDPETAAIARRYFAACGVAAKVELRLAPALDTLAALASEGMSFDMVFIDADKENYVAYYEKAIGLLRPNGVLLADNVLWGGAIVDTKNQDASTLALRAFNEHVRKDKRVEAGMLPIADGIYCVRKL